MLLTVALLFILSWLPLWTLMMLSDYVDLSPNELQVINIYIYPFAHWLAFCNTPTKTSRVLLQRVSRP